MNKEQASCDDIYKEWQELYKAGKEKIRNASGPYTTWFNARDLLREKELKSKIRAKCIDVLDLSPEDRYEINNKE